VILIRSANSGYVVFAICIAGKAEHVSWQTPAYIVPAHDNPWSDVSLNVYVPPAHVAPDKHATHSIASAGRYVPDAQLYDIGSNIGTALTVPDDLFNVDTEQPPFVNTESPDIAIPWFVVAL